MRSIGADPKEWPKEPFEDLEHLIADLAYIKLLYLYGVNNNNNNNTDDDDDGICS